MTSAPPITAVDLFCGVGGLTHGLEESGIRVVAGLDLDAGCEFPYESNNEAKFLRRDIEKVPSEEVVDLFGDARPRLLAGCAPCQPFSTYSRGHGVRHQNDWRLLLAFGRLVRDVKPELVTMENVPQIARHAVFKEFVRTLDGYHVWWDVVDCASYGVPQTRKRLVLLGSRLSADRLSLEPKKSPAASVRDTIGALPRLEAGQSSSRDPLHTASRLSAKNKERIRASVPGGTWRDWPPALQAECHQRPTGVTFPSVYGRMEWDAPAPTITTQCFGYGNGRFGHPEQDRAISLREAAMLQTFPEGYRFVREPADVRFNKMGRLIGNAVPVRLGRLIGETLVEHVRAAAERDGVN